MLFAVSAWPGELPGIRVERELLRMRDGVELSATYFLPLNVDGKKLPVLLELLPYRKDDDFFGRDYALCEYFARNGLAVARVDIRGTGSSEGRVPEREYSEAELRDAEELVLQLSRKPWSNGNVGMYGISWGGFNAIQLAMRKPKALKAILATDASDDLFHDDIHYIDGIFHVDEYSLDIDHANGLPASPEYRIDPAYFRDRFDREPWILAYKARQRDGAWWRKGSLRFQRPLEIPALLIGGLLDGYRDSIPRMLERARAPVKAIIGPWVHDWPDNAEPGPAFEWRPLAVRWWKHWLAGEPLPDLGKPNLQVFVRSGHGPELSRKESPGSWRLEEWPIRRSVRTALHLHPGQRLKEPVPAKAWLVHRGSAAAGAELGYWWGENTGDMSSLGRQSVVFDSDPVQKPRELIGRPRLRFRAASSARLAHWVARLEDVGPDGKVSFITGGALNGAQRASRSSPAPLRPGKFHSFELDLHFSTWTFQPGHRIRLALSNGSFPMFWPAPEIATSRIELGAGSVLELPEIPATASAQLPELPVIEARKSHPAHRDHEGGQAWNPLPERLFPEIPGRPRFGGSGSEGYSIGDLQVSTARSVEYGVSEEDPASAWFLGSYEHRIRKGPREFRLATRMRLRSDRRFFHVDFTRRIFEAEALLREKSWKRSIPRDFQ